MTFDKNILNSLMSHIEMVGNDYNFFFQYGRKQSRNIEYACLIKKRPWFLKFLVSLLSRHNEDLGAYKRHGFLSTVCAS